MSSFQHLPVFNGDQRGLLLAFSSESAPCFGSESPDKLLPYFILAQGLGQPWSVQTGLLPVKLQQKVLSWHLVWSAHSTGLNLDLSKNCMCSRWEFVELILFSLYRSAFTALQLVTETQPRGAQQWQTALWSCRTLNIIVLVLSLLLHESGRTQVSV